MNANAIDPQKTAQHPAPDERLLTRPEVAARLRVCTKTVDNEVRAGRLHGLKIGERRLFTFDEVRQYIVDRINETRGETVTA